ncbi:hypothetical protein K469DRAFT_794782 [Zopfia rhizophila CBS 207.26]|uniref:Uncharacterized protein n=1 Tax=Zopfia rhizophila CBS 207.26 TaxID=1314779 RepID=A0A6A6DLT1_9PEZI|nr:hypothetical protein K469DRAFT_794782 [Zopfia rhizophila CBS 207.26]
MSVPVAARLYAARERLRRGFSPPTLAPLVLSPTLPSNHTRLFTCRLVLRQRLPYLSSSSRTASRPTNPSFHSLQTSLTVKAFTRVVIIGRLSPIVAPTLELLGLEAITTSVDTYPTGPILKVLLYRKERAV